jgi:hypothetical protein
MTRKEKTKAKRILKISRIIFYTSILIFVTSFISVFLGILKMLPDMNSKVMFMGLFIILPFMVFITSSLVSSTYYVKFNFRFDMIKKYRQYMKFHRVINKIELGDIEEAIDIYNMMYRDEHKVYLDAYLTSTCLNSNDEEYKEKGMKMIKRALDYTNPDNIKINEFKF